MKSFTIAVSASLAAFVLLAAASPARADDDGDDDAPRALGPHPAIVVQRLHASAGYDYAAKFYPHPAGLRLLAQPPHEHTELALTPAPDSESGPLRRPRPARLRARVGRADVGDERHVR